MSKSRITPKVTQAGDRQSIRTPPAITNNISHSTGDGGETPSIWFLIQKSRGGLVGSTDDSEILNEMARITVNAFLHLALNESPARAWHDVIDELCFLDMLRGITAYQYIQFMVVPLSGESQEGYRLAQADCLSRAYFHWATAATKLLARLRDSMTKTKATQLDLEDWLFVEEVCKKLSLDELAMIDATISTVENHRVSLTCREDAQRSVVCPVSLQRRAMRANQVIGRPQSAEVGISTRQSNAGFLRYSIEGFLEEGYCIYCGNSHQD